MLNWIKGHKKMVILIIVLALLLTGFLVIRSKAKEAMAALTQLTEETAYVERRSIQSSISSTGEIISDNTRDISAELAGYEVLSVEVEVGDVVQAGDVLCVFDTGDLEEGLEDAEKTLYAAETQSDVTVNNAYRALEMAIETKNYQIENAARNVISACDAYDNARENYNSMKTASKEAKQALEDAEKLKQSVPASCEEMEEYKAYLDAQAEYDAAFAAFEAFVPDETLDEATNNANREALLDAALAAEKTCEEAKKKAAEAGATLEFRKLAAEAAYASAAKNLETVKASLAAAESALDSARTARDSAEAAYEYTVASQESSFRGSKDALRSAEAGAGVSTIQQENAVETYKEQIEKGALTANIGGTVTAVNIHAGEKYAGGPIVTIQDTDALVVAAEIDEYDIADIKIGMKAVFKTDATRDEQLTGEVIFVSPTPTFGSDVTYQVKVRIDSDTGRLRIGMNAKLNIILAETADVLTVPYDAIQQDEQGNDIIYAVERGEKGEAIRTAIPVTVGVEGDYYVEVSGAITEGMEIALPTDKYFDLAAMQEEMMASMGG